MSSALPSLKEQFGDDLIWCLLARVAVHDGESKHFYVNEEGQVVVSVLTNRGSVPVDCLMKGGSLDKQGIWRIPSVGTEVLVGFSEGEFEGDPVIVNTYGHAPDGLEENTTYVLDAEVQIRTVEGTAEKLPTLADYNALKNFIQNMTLAVIGGGGGTAGPPTPGSVPSATGTTVLKAE